MILRSSGNCLRACFLRTWKAREILRDSGNPPWTGNVLSTRTSSSQYKTGLWTTDSLRSWRDSGAGERAAEPPYSLAKPAREFNSTLHQSSHGLATRVHGFSTKTKALAREIPPATQARLQATYGLSIKHWLRCKTRTKHYGLDMKNLNLCIKADCGLIAAYWLQSVFYTDQS